MKNFKSIEYYLSLNYPIEHRRLTEEEGGGFMATIPSLGRYAFVGDGETLEEALSCLNDVKEDLFQDFLKRGVPIPEPIQEEDEEFSGKILLRLPAYLHGNLANRAKKNGVSLNQYLLSLLSSNYSLDSVREELLQIKNQFSYTLEKMWPANRVLRDVKISTQNMTSKKKKDPISNPGTLGFAA